MPFLCSVYVKRAKQCRKWDRKLRCHYNMKTLVTVYFQPTKCLIKRPTFCLLGKVFAFSCQAKTRILFALERTQALLQSGVRPIFVCAHARTRTNSQTL